MGTIPSYPPPTIPFDGTEQLAGWQDGQQVSIPVTDVVAAANADAHQAATDAETAASAAEAAVGPLLLKLGDQAPAGYVGGVCDLNGRFRVLFKPDLTMVIAEAEIDALTITSLEAGGASITQNAPPGFARAWGDAHGRFCLGITDDGGLAAPVLEDVVSINGKNWSEIVAGTQSSTTPVLDAEINLFCFYGQSKPAGTQSIPPLTTVQLYDGLRFADGVRPYDAATPARSSLVALIETDNGGSGSSELAETPAGGFNETLKERIFAENGILYTDRPYQMLMTCEARGGTAISGLQSGTGPYNDIESDIGAMRTLAQAAGKTSKFRAFGWSHGESDYAANTPLSSYRPALVGIRTGLDAYAKAANPANGDVYCFVDQVFAHATYGHANDPYIALDQLALCQTDPHFVMVGNFAHLPNSGYPHWTNAGSKWAGAYYARAYKRVIIDGGTWKPLVPVEAYRDGTVVLVRFAPESGQLVFDTATIAAQASMGFSLADPGGSAITINSVSLLAKDTVKIVAATTLAAGSFVRMGYGSLGATNLRDSMGDTIVANMGGLNKPLHNWCVINSQTLS